MSWDEQTLRLQEKHRWKCKEGYAIFVLNRGAVRFDYPATWVLKHTARTVKIHDREPPDDNCTLEVSHVLLAPIDWSGLPVGELLEKSSPPREDERVLERKPVVVERRGELELAVLEKRYIESQQNREAISRVAIGRVTGIQCLITFDFWADQAADFSPVWDEVMRTLVLGVYVKDPTAGPVVH